MCTCVTTINFFEWSLTSDRLTYNHEYDLVLYEVLILDLRV